MSGVVINQLDRASYGLCAVCTVFERAVHIILCVHCVKLSSRTIIVSVRKPQRVRIRETIKKKNCITRLVRTFGVRIRFYFFFCPTAVVSTRRNKRDSVSSTKQTKQQKVFGSGRATINRQRDTVLKHDYG